MTTNIKLNGYGIKYPTNDSRIIKLGPGKITGKLHLRFEHKEKEFEIGSKDVIAADFRIPDSEGRVWLLTTRFTSEMLLRHTFDLTIWDSGLFFLEDCRPEIKKSLNDNTVLQSIFCGDDIKRSYRVCISNQLFTLSFKLSQCTFDIATHTPELLVVKINDYSILSDTDYIGNFAYLLPVDVLFKNNTAIFHKPIEFADEDWLEGFWYDSEIPLPLCFRLTDEVSNEPQMTVLVERS